MPELPGLWSLTPIGALLLVIVLFYWMLATGRVITRSSHERELALANKRGDEWKDTALDGRTIITKQANQIDALVESNRIADHFFQSVGRHGDGDVGT
jgi:hypothetical protein